jgi:hypothetical protein
MVGKHGRVRRRFGIGRQSGMHPGARWHHPCCFICTVEGLGGLSMLVHVHGQVTLLHCSWLDAVHCCLACSSQAARAAAQLTVQTASQLQQEPDRYASEVIQLADSAQKAFEGMMRHVASFARSAVAHACLTMLRHGCCSTPNLALSVSGA